MEEIKKEVKYCSGKCSQCHKYVKVVPDPTDPDPFNDDDVAMFCSNPSNNMERMDITFTTTEDHGQSYLCKVCE